MQLLTVDTLEQAKSKLIPFIKKQGLKTCTLPLLKAQGYVVAKDCVAPFSVPHFRRSTVDGYAIWYEDSIGVSESLPSFLKVLGSVNMGEENTFEVSRGTCVYVPTGAMLPKGANAVVMIEYTEKLSDTEIAIYQNVANNAHVVQIAEDIEENSVVIKKGTIIRPHEIAMLASLGVQEVTVYAKPSLAIISLGDEVLALSEPLVQGKIYDINSYGLFAQAEKFGFDVVAFTKVNDERERIKETLVNYMQLADIVVLSGGSSQGEKDFTESILSEVASEGILTHGIAIKPGKPTITSYDEKTKTVLLGLPGHPVAAMLLFELLLVSIYDILQEKQERLAIHARMSCNFPSADGKLTCQLVELSLQDNMYIATPIFGKSGIISTLSKANGYILIDMNTEGIKKGESVLVRVL